MRISNTNVHVVHIPNARLMRHCLPVHFVHTCVVCVLTDAGFSIHVDDMWMIHVDAACCSNAGTSEPSPDSQAPRLTPIARFQYPPDMRNGDVPSPEEVNPHAGYSVAAMPHDGEHPVVEVTPCAPEEEDDEEIPREWDNSRSQQAVRDWRKPSSHEWDNSRSLEPKREVDYSRSHQTDRKFDDSKPYETEGQAHGSSSYETAPRELENLRSHNTGMEIDRTQNIEMALHERDDTRLQHERNDARLQRERDDARLQQQTWDDSARCSDEARERDLETSASPQAQQSHLNRSFLNDRPDGDTGSHGLSDDDRSQSDASDAAMANDS